MTPTGVVQHGGLSPERWTTFAYDQQILMIANEMNRGLGLLKLQAFEHARRSYERVLQLVDLTVAATSNPHRRRELLRWRDLPAELFLEAMPDAEAHRRAFRCLLQFTPSSAHQIASLLAQ